MASSSTTFWRGFAAGAATGFTALALLNRAGRTSRSVVRLDKSIQIGRSVEEVFNAWNDFEHLSRASHIIEAVRRHGDRSHWQINLDGRRLAWDSEIEQFIPNQAVGWKSLRGPKHTGRINFSPLGNDTLVQVVMNYQPPLPWLRPFFPTMSMHLEKFLERVLRDFKASLEGKGQEGREQPVRGTGTYGPGGERPAHEKARASGFRSAADISAQQPVKPTAVNPVEYTRPPERKS